MRRYPHDPLDGSAGNQLELAGGGDRHLTIGGRGIEQTTPGPLGSSVDVAEHPQTGIATIALDRLVLGADEDSGGEWIGIAARSQQQQQSGKAMHSGHTAIVLGTEAWRFRCTKAPVGTGAFSERRERDLNPRAG